MNSKLLRVAVASNDGVAINEHFGHAKSFYIYDVTPSYSQHIETRDVNNYCLGNHSDKSALQDILATISDCCAVFVARIGDGPTEKLAAQGIQAVSQYTWEEVTPSLLSFANKVGDK